MERGSAPARLRFHLGLFFRLHFIHFPSILYPFVSFSPSFPLSLSHGRGRGRRETPRPHARVGKVERRMVDFCPFSPSVCLSVFITSLVLLPPLLSPFLTFSLSSSFFTLS